MIKEIGGFCVGDKIKVRPEHNSVWASYGIMVVVELYKLEDNEDEPLISVRGGQANAGVFSPNAIVGAFRCANCEGARSNEDDYVCRACRKSLDERR